MEPKAKQIKKNESEEVVEKKTWVTPEVEEHVMVEKTQSTATPSGVDGQFNYS